MLAERPTPEALLRHHLSSQSQRLAPKRSRARAKPVLNGSIGILAAGSPLGLQPTDKEYQQNPVTAEK
jgi:hypothetical protein